ncbi:MAG: hypothetical protein CVV01_05595 [Firmicutes bacterium HGW-Firmicutes-6]|jgi:HK97 gp10 family phage protein|nr:MAG: hypothetical protein CVV01_05595 [Firmicutes bacterium HGW-Firmicutes-6]
MAIPKSVTKIIKKDGKNEVTFTSNVDRVNYTLNELTRAALRDSGKFIVKMFKDDYYSFFDKQTGRVGKYAQYWVRKKENDLQVGIKPNAFYGGFQEKGTEKQPALGMLTHAAEDNIAEIVRIQSQYLSALESEAEALALIDEEEYEGNADE